MDLKRIYNDSEIDAESLELNEQKNKDILSMANAKFLFQRRRRKK